MGLVHLLSDYHAAQRRTARRSRDPLADRYSARREIRSIERLARMDGIALSPAA